LADVVPPHRTLDGDRVDLGYVGVPAARADMRLIKTLLSEGFVPVVACIGLGRDGRLLNVNADMFAGHFAARLGARRLVIAGTTAGVLGPEGETLRRLDHAAVTRLLATKSATAGMIAKLRASQEALESGVDDVVIVDGRNAAALIAAGGDEVPTNATQLVGDRRLQSKSQV
jgi:acetylglutamate kinase